MLVIKRLEVDRKRKEQKISQLQNKQQNSGEDVVKEGCKVQNLNLIAKNKSLAEKNAVLDKQNKEMRAKVNLFEAKYIKLNSRIGNNEFRGKLKMTINELVEDMPESMTEAFIGFEEKDYTESDILKFIFAQFLPLTNPRKIQLLKRILEFIDPTTRGCVAEIVAKLHDDDKKNKKFLKVVPKVVAAEKSDDDFDIVVKAVENETTPNKKRCATWDSSPDEPSKKPKLKVDDIMYGIDTSKFLNDGNINCKFIYEKQVCYIAYSAENSFVTHHKLGKKGRCGLPGCNKIWTSSEDVIAPITICGPEYERKYGDMVWACFAAYKYEAETHEKEDIKTRSKSKATKKLFANDDDNEPKPGSSKAKHAMVNQNVEKKVASTEPSKKDQMAKAGASKSANIRKKPSNQEDSDNASHKNDVDDAIDDNIDGSFDE